MDFDLASLAGQMTPAQKQAFMAQVMRGRGREEQQQALQQAGEQSRQFDTLAAVAPLMNNAGAVKSALTAQKSAGNLAPVQMGNQGFMLPGSGQFAESPMYADEKEAGRQSVLANTMERTRAAKESSDARLQETIRNNDMRNVLGQTMAQIAASRGDGAADRRAMQQEAAAEKAKAAAGKVLDDRVTKFSGAMETAAVPQFDSALSLVEGTLSKYKPGELPGFGRVEGWVPGVLATDKQQAVRADMQQAANILLKARSGAAVTDGEMRRFLMEVGSGSGMDEKTLRKGWENIRQTFNAQKNNLLSGVDDAVLGEYNSRSQSPLSRAKAAPSSAAGGTKKVGSVAEAQSLPPGTRFIDPNGVERVR